MLERKAGPWLKLIGAVVAAVLVAPISIIIPLSFTDRRSFQFPPEGWSISWYRNFFEDEAWLSSLANSFKIAIGSALVATALGTIAAFAVRRAGPRRAKWRVGLFMAPMVVPLIVSAITLYMFFLRLGISGTVHGFILGHSVLSLPFVFVAVSTSLRAFDSRLELAAASLGAGPWTVFRTVTAPLVAKGIATGAVFAFAISFDEVVLALFLQSPSVRTLPIQMFSSVARDVDPTIAAASTLMFAVTTVAIAGYSYFQVRRQGTNNE